MLRRSFSKCCQLESKFKAAQAVWNIEFGERAMTKTMDFHHSVTKTAPPVIPMFHVLDNDGNVVNPEYDPKWTKEFARNVLEVMHRNHKTEEILLDSQRQGRISFFMTGFGEEAANVGTAAALEKEDVTFLQYREMALLSYRGLTLQQIVAQCMGNIEDKGKGRQMPMHFGSKALNAQTISSPLGTQIPHASGAGYAFKLEKADRIAVCFFGDGAASEGDFHAGVNFAATRGSHTLFVCRNNGYAIATPTVDQYRGDGITPRGIAYGIPSMRVDGTDALAVYAAVKKAREMILKESMPVMLELMGYRVGDHSTSDDSTRYREVSEIEHFKNAFDPIARLEKYLVKQGWWDSEQSTALQQEQRKLVLNELKRQEKVPLYPVTALFEDTTAEPMPHLKEQMEETVAHFERNRKHYEA